MIRAKSTITVGNLCMQVLYLVMAATPMFSGNSNFIVLWGLYGAFIALSMLWMLKLGTIPLYWELRYQFLFTLYCLLSNFWAQYRVQSIQFPVLMFLFMLMACMCITRRPNYTAFLNAFILGGVGTSLYVLFSSGLGSYLEAMGSGRLGGEVLQENLLGVVTAVAAVLAIGMYLQKGRKKIYLAAAAINLFVLFGTASRVGMLALMAGLVALLYIIFVLWGGQKLNALLRYAVILLAVLAVGGVLLSRVSLFAKMFERFYQMLLYFVGTSTSAEGTGIRSDLIRIGWQQFIEHPFFGIGYNNARFAASEMLGVEFYMHNNYIEILANGGLVGFALFYIPYILLFRKLWKQMRSKDFEVAIAFVMLIMIGLQSMAGVPYLNKEYYTYMAFIVCVANRRKSVSEDAEQEEGYEEANA